MERGRASSYAPAVIRHLMMPGHEVARAFPLANERIASFLARNEWSKRVQCADGKCRWTWKLPTVCLVNGEFVFQRAWKRRRIKATDKIVFVSRPLGGGSGSSGKQVLGIVALIAASALALWAGPAIAGTLFGGSALAGGLITAGITVGASLLINALVAPKAGGQADSTQELDTPGLLAVCCRQFGTCPANDPCELRPTAQVL